MDPYLEGSRWHGFHTLLCGEVVRVLTPKLGEKYAALINERLLTDEYEVELLADKHFLPDVSIVRERRAAYGAATLEPPIRMTAPLEIRTKVHFVEIRQVDDMELISLIEILSPANKRGDGRQQYLEKRRQILNSHVNLIEIDLLRVGQRMPMNEHYPPEPYVVMVHRASQRPVADVWPIALTAPLPCIPVPLEDDDPDVMLDLQIAFTGAFDAARYDRVLHYGDPPPARLTDSESEWADQLLRTSGLRG